MGNKIFYSICLLSMLLISCSKQAGEGGTSTIKGKIKAKQTDVFGNVFEYYLGKEDVFIIYGEADFYGNDVKTNYDGTYEFSYLKKGKYTIYAYSDCDTCLGYKREELKTVDITQNKSENIVEDLVIIKQ